jgi:hypothetical protein
MNETSVAVAFQEWWTESYKRPPGSHAVMTHVGFAMHILEMAGSTNKQAPEGEAQEGQ